DEWSRRVLALRRDLVLRHGVAEQFRFALHLIFSPASFRAMRDRIAEIEARVAANPPDERAYLRQLEFLIGHDTCDRLGSIRVPTLVVAGERDVLASPFQGRELAALVPGAEYVELPGAAHALNWEEPERLAELIAAHVEHAE